MPKRQSPTGSELFIVDNSDEDWKAARYLRDWCQLSSAIDIATGYFEIGALLALGTSGRRLTGKLDDGIEVGSRMTLIDSVAAQTVAAMVKPWTA
ncbi:MAG: hypothetical protein IPN63_11655 [Gammaproteobacteria bacterium]|nr:hypothetical protein [Gammaproteobacteria bacterium]